MRLGFITTSRADLGIQSCIIRRIVEDAPNVEAFLLVGGEQLRRADNELLETIGADLHIHRLHGGSPIDDSWGTAVEYVGKMATAVFASIVTLNLKKLVILGDRYEVLGAAYAGCMSSAEVVHIHGGEVTLGAIDEYMRHAISKLSNTHLVTSISHRRRLLAMGERPEDVHVVGPIGAESLALQPILSRSQLELEIGHRLAKTNVHLAFHSETLAPDYGKSHLSNILTAIARIPDCFILVSGTNSDPGSDEISQEIMSFVQTYSDRALFWQNLGTRLYANVLRHFDIMIGNSSSGLLEAPAFGVQVINVGLRQGGREGLGQVSTCTGEMDEIEAALGNAMEASKNSRLVFGSSDTDFIASSAAFKVLIENPKTNKTKKFYDGLQ